MAWRTRVCAKAWNDQLHDRGPREKEQKKMWLCTLLYVASTPIFTNLQANGKNSGMFIIFRHGKMLNWNAVCSEK